MFGFNRPVTRLLPASIISFLLLLTSLRSAYAAQSLITLTVHKRDTDISVDAYPVEEMMIEQIKAPRLVTQTELQTLTEALIAANPSSDWEEAGLLDSILRVYGVPVSRQVTTSGAALQISIRQSINAGLPLILIGANHQVIVTGYRTDPFEIYVINPDPLDTSNQWRPLTDLTLSNPSMTINEFIVPVPQVTIPTSSYGTLIFNTATNTLSEGAPPAEARLRQALMSSASFIAPGEHVLLLDYGDNSTELQSFITLLRSDQADGLASGVGTLAYWDSTGFADNAYFPILPLDQSGYVDVTSVKESIRDLSLYYTTMPTVSGAISSRSHISPEEAAGARGAFNWLYTYHIGFNTSSIYTRILRDIVTHKNAIAYEVTPYRDQMRQAYQDSLAALLPEYGYTVLDGLLLTDDMLKSVDKGKLFAKNLELFRKANIPAAQAQKLAGYVVTQHNGLQSLLAHAKTRNKEIHLELANIGVGLSYKVISAIEPLAYIEGTVDELITVRDYLQSRSENPTLVQALNTVIVEKDGENSRVLDYLVDYLFNEGLEDLAGIATDEVIGFMKDKLIQAGFQSVGPLYAAVQIGIFLGNLLSGLEEVDEHMRYAVTALEIEEVLHRIAYTDARSRLVNSYTNHLDASLVDIRLWDASVHLTYLAESYFWYQEAEAYHTSGWLSNGLTALHGYGSAKDVSENYFMPLARDAGQYATTWHNSSVVAVATAITARRLWGFGVGVLAAGITNVDGISPPAFEQKVDGNIPITYIVNGQDGPFNIILKVDSTTLVSHSATSGTYSFVWDSSSWHDGQPHYLSLTATDTSGESVTDSVVVIVGQIANAAPSIQLLTPNNNTDFRNFRIDWVDDDPDDNAIITLGYDTNSSGCDGTTIQNWISEDWQTDYWYWNTLGLTGSYWVYATIRDDFHDPVCVYSPGRLTIETASSANGFTIDHVSIDDSDYGNGDGIWQSEERVELDIYLHNSTGGLLNEVYAAINTSEPSIALNDPDAVYNNVLAGQTNHNRDIEVSAAPGLSGNVPFQLEVYYRENGGPLRKDVETFNLPVTPAGSGPYFSITGVTFTDNDPTEADNDGHLESADKHVLVNLQLANTGNATASNVTIVADPPGTMPTLWQHSDTDYPDIPAGSSALPSPSTLKISEIPVNFSGAIPIHLTVYYGTNQQFSQGIDYSITVEAAPLLIVQSPHYDFGVVAPGTPVSHGFTIQNTGSATASISSVTASNPDLTFTNVPSSIPAGGSATITANINTTGLDASIVRVFTINSNAHIRSRNTGDIAGTVHLIVSSTYQMILQEEMSDGPTNIDGGDTDGDGLKEIILPVPLWDNINYNNYTRIRLLEQIAVGADVFSEVWNSGDTTITGPAGNANLLAVDDINGDGKTDVIVATTNGGSLTPGVYYLTTNGNNSLSITRIMAANSGFGFTSVSIGDPDGDGKKDVVVGAYNNNSPVDSRVYVLEYVSGTTFATRWTSPQITDTWPSPGPTRVCATASGDTDVDSYGEIILGTSEGELNFFESTGNDTYSSSALARFELEGSLGGSYDWCDLAIRDLDADSIPDIVYVSEDSNKAFIVERTGNNTWATSWAQALTATSSDDMLSVSTGDSNGNGKPDLAVSYNGSGAPDGVVVIESIGNNSYAPIFSVADPNLIQDRAQSVSVVNIDNTSLPEILLGQEYYGYTVLGLAKDLIIQNADVQVSPPNLVEGTLATLSAWVTNQSGQSLPNVAVNFYNGDPATSGTLLGTITLPSVTTATVGQAQITYTFNTAGTYDIYALVDPDNHLVEGNENNNKSHTTITVADNDTTAPAIGLVTGNPAGQITFAENSGDGDGLIEDNEQALVTWAATDASGIAATSLTTDCTVGSVSLVSGLYHAVISSCSIGEHFYQVLATDADNTPLSTTLTGVFNVYAHQPQIVGVSPANSSASVSRASMIQVQFGATMDPASLTTTSFTLTTLGGTPVAGMVSYDSNQQRATFSPNGLLASNVTYVARLLTGIDGIRDMHNNHLDALYSWQFTTVPNQQPSPPLPLTPTDGETDTSNMLTLSWAITDPENDPLEFTVYLGSSNPPAVAACTDITTFACGTGTLAQGQTYYWYVVASDGAAQRTGPVWSFTTRPPDLTPPQVTLVNTVPDTGDGSLSQNEVVAAAITRLLITYSEPVNNPPGFDDPEDVENPDNYLLAVDWMGTVDTSSCSAGLAGDDVRVDVDYALYVGHHDIVAENA